MKTIAVRLDANLIAVFDRLMKLAQWHGWPLHTAIMVTDCLFAASSVSFGIRISTLELYSDWPLAITVILAGYFLFLAHRRWHHRDNYRNSSRMMAQLNANAAAARHQWDIRLGAIVIFAAAAVTFNNAQSWISAATIFMQLYLHCCFYIGPGDLTHSHEKRP